MEKRTAIQAVKAIQSLGLTAMLSFASASAASATASAPQASLPFQDDVLYRNPPLAMSPDTAKHGRPAYHPCDSNRKARYILIFHPEMHFTKDDLNHFFEEDIVISLSLISNNSYRAQIKHSAIECRDFLKIIESAGITQATVPMSDYEGYPSYSGPR
jgi:hypothetical protein